MYLINNTTNIKINYWGKKQQNSNNKAPNMWSIFALPAHLETC